MPRRNLLILMVVVLLAAACYLRVQKNRYIRVVAYAMDTIESRALEPIGDKRLFEGAMNGVLGQLDENSIYVPANELDEFKEDIECEFAGVGMEVALDPRTKQLTVRSPLAGSPAYEAGVLAGDRILKIDGRSTEEMTLSDATALLRGPAGESVAISILHAGEKEPVEVVIVREIIHEDTVLGDTRNEDGSWNYSLDGYEGIGYVRISNFSETTADELEYVLNELTKQGMRGLALDLRNDPGGWLLAAVDVCDQLIDSGAIVTTRRRGGVEETHQAGGRGPFAKLPIAVIVNQETASAAEIVAACLQDHKRAAIVGWRTYGKGTVQELVDFPSGFGAMKLTTASYWRPSGKDIQRPRDAKETDQWGVMPDKGFEVKLTEKEYNEWQKWRVQRDVFQRPEDGGKDAKPYVDRQRQKAVEYLEKTIK